MYEANIAKSIEIGESMQLLDVYNKKHLIRLFKIFQMIIFNKMDNILIYIILKLIFFIQIFTYSLISTPRSQEENDTIIKLIKGIRKIILPHLFVSTNNQNQYLYLFVIVSFIILIIIISFLYVFIKYNSDESQSKVVKVLNIFSILLYNYLECPTINILFFSIACDEGKHIYLNSSKCYSSNQQIIMMAISFLLLILILLYSIVLSIFNYDIGTIDERDTLSRVNCNYELYENIGMIIFYIFGFFVRIYLPKKKITRLLFKGYLIIFSTGFTIYLHKYLFYYNNTLNFVTIIGWLFVDWYSFVFILKDIVNLQNSILFLLIGWFLLGVLYYLIENNRIERTWTGSQIFETQSIKEIETLISHLLNLTKIRDTSSVMVKGIINVFELNFSDDPELNAKSQKFLTNANLQKQFGGNENFHFHLYNLVFLIYDYFLEKPLLKNDIMLIMCYFLVNSLKNHTYAISLCSQIKVSGIKTMYLKYLLMEKIKIHQLKHLSTDISKESISRIQIGSLIVYYNYIDNFKIKIYDAVTSQIEYFDTLKNNQTSNSNIENFLKAGEKIIGLRKEIILLWDKIMKLNPFCEENEQDYLLYLSKIIQDKDMALKEEERYRNFRNERLVYRNNFYYTLFNSDVLSVILVDGNQLRGKLLYTTPNFGFLFNFTPKELISAYIYFFQPTIISNFHKDLVDETLKYSNLSSTFKDKKKLIMKGKSGGIFNILSYIKCIPNLSYGLMYIMTIEKYPDNCFNIVLDNNFYINEMSEEIPINVENEINNNNQNFNLSNNLIGHHIGLILPEILKELEFKNEKFIFKKVNLELKGKLFPNTSIEQSDKEVETILEQIKKSGKLTSDEEEIEYKKQESNLKISTTKLISLKKKKKVVILLTIKNIKDF